MLANGRAFAVAIAVDDEVDLIRGMVDLYQPILDRLVLAEGTTTFQGEPRTVIGAGWRELLPLAGDRLKVITAELPATGVSPRRRERLQRAALRLGLAGLPDDALLVLADADEFLSPRWLAGNADIAEIRHLLLVPLFGGLDRRAPDWHCCAGHLNKPMGTVRAEPADWLIPGPLAGPLAQLAPRSASRPDILAARGQGAAGWHLLHVLPAAADPARKLRRQAHDWDDSELALVSQYVAAGVHPRGWWLAESHPPPAELAFLAARHPEVLAGPLPDLGVRMQLLADALTQATSGPAPQ